MPTTLTSRYVTYEPFLSENATATYAANASVIYSPNAQTVTLSATVISADGPVNGGTETFTILNGSTDVGTPVTSNVVSGAASGAYTIPAGTLGGVYTIQAVFSGTSTLSGSSDSSHTLTIGDASTTTAASSATTTFSASNQTISLSATVTSSAGIVNEGTETFTILSGTTPVGIPATADVSDGAVTASYTLPGGTAGGTYTIEAVYNGTADYGSSTDTSHSLTINAPPTIMWNTTTAPTGGDWDTPGNWVGGVVPTASDNVVINLTSSRTVTHSTGANDAALSVTTSSNVILSGGTLTVTGTVEVSSGSTLSLQGGTLADATMTGGSTLTLTNSGGSLTGGVTIAAGATLDATQNITGSQDYAYVSGGLTLNGAINLGNASGSVYGDLYFENGPQTLSGTGTVTLGTSTSNYLKAYGPNTAATLTIGSGITVQGGSGTVGGYYSTDSIVNNGTITSASGQTLTIQGSNWVNNGTITANGATVNLGGSFTTAALGSFSASGSTVNLTGTLNNANTTFTLSPAIGAWKLDGGTINGGTITSTGGSTLALTDSGGTLAGGVTIASGTTLDGTQNIGGSQDYANVTGGLTLNGTINLGNATGQHLRRTCTSRAAPRRSPAPAR